MRFLRKDEKHATGDAGRPSFSERRLPQDSFAGFLLTSSYWMGSPCVRIAAAAAKVEVVVIEEREHVGREGRACRNEVELTTPIWDLRQVAGASRASLARPSARRTCRPRRGR